MWNPRSTRSVTVTLSSPMRASPTTWTKSPLSRNRGASLSADCASAGWTTNAPPASIPVRAMFRKPMNKLDQGTLHPPIAHIGRTDANEFEAHWHFMIAGPVKDAAAWKWEAPVLYHRHDWIGTDPVACACAARCPQLELGGAGAGVHPVDRDGAFTV